MVKKAYLYALSIVILASTLSLAAEARSVDVTYANGSITLAAELMLPAGDGPFPAVVILQGSGVSDRTNAWSRAFSEVFTRRGVAALLTDKRGCGRSAGQWRTSSFEDLAADALAGVSFLKERPEIDGKRVGVVGLSQGGWVAPIAAARSSEPAFVIALSGPGVTFVEQGVVEIANTAREVGLGDSDVAAMIALHVAAGRYLMTGEWRPYENRRAAAMKSAAKPVAAGFPEAPDSPEWAFIRKVGLYDPLPYWSAVSQPAFIAFGEQDEQQNVPVAESVRRLEFLFARTGKKNFEIVVAPAVGHGLYARAYEFAPVVLERLDAWLKREIGIRAD